MTDIIMTLGSVETVCNCTKTITNINLTAICRAKAKKLRKGATFG